MCPAFFDLIEMCRSCTRVANAYQIRQVGFAISLRLVWAEINGWRSGKDNLNRGIEVRARPSKKPPALESPLHTGLGMPLSACLDSQSCWPLQA